MVDPLSGDIMNALPENPLAPAAGSSNALASGNFLGDLGALLSALPEDVEAAETLDLVTPAIVESALTPSSLVSVAAATVELSPEALAQAAAAGLPATLSDDSPAFPRSLEARRANPDGDVGPISGAELWQEAIQLFRENDSSMPSRQPRPRANPVCPFCGKIHDPLPADGPADNEESCPSVQLARADDQP